MKTTAAALLALLLPCVASAQQPTARDFARWGEVSEVALSPDGKYLAMGVPTADNRETRLQVVPLDGVGKPQILRFGNMEHVSDIVWTGNNTITVARASNMALEPRPYSRGQLFSTDPAGKGQQTLFGYFRDHDFQSGRRKDEGFAQVVQVLDDEPNKALVEFTCWDCGEKPDTWLYKVDTITGAREQLERITDASVLWVDRHGRARIFSRTDDDENVKLFYRPTPGSAWTPMPKSLVGLSIGTAVFDTDDNTVYMAISDHGEASSFYRVDLKAGTRTLLPSKSPGFNVDSILLGGRKGAPFGLISDLSKPSVTYFDPNSEYAQLHSSLMKAFPGHLIRFGDFARDNSKVLFSASSDHDPGSWYLLDRSTNKVQRVAEYRSWLKPEQMATTIPIEFQSRHGETIHGFLTTNHNGPGPMVVMPHGGPHGVMDTWGFDPEAQFLASRGYSVLQVNYRGSGGRGRDFTRLGYREWGGKMQDDIADGVKWVIDHKGADPGRICTYGASYGGYAAMMQVIRFPELYKCAIGYVGVYDLALMNKVGDIQESKSGRRYLDRVLGNDPAVLAANSPAHNIDKIKVPVFLAAGSIDQRVPIDQFKALRNAMESKGVKVETMVADGEGHGFYGVDNRTQLFERMEAFLKKYIGDGSAPASH